ncbi:HAMP domain-containing sensor histidine kinase [Brevundimonas diminuta]|uniref:sensor histidine kinase n=1 Tax=Brevundimonas diminuta TaxID=293 RepID=UPI0022B00196|nr:HAMP domain-containing sensor histidine kinase [Brevundimonas diminuta]MCZ4108039.1 HAMP domain-containing sensor histidine kinase [Brevundimonas diminuta]
MSIRSLSIRTLAAGFTVAAILLSLTVAFVIALAFPAPPPARVTLAEAEAAVTRDAETGWRRRVVAAPPFKAAHEGQALVAQVGLAVLLDAEVRVRPLSPERAPAGGPSAPSGPLSEGTKALLTSMALSPGMSFAPFEAAARQADGRWVVATPPSPWLTPQRLRMGLAFLIAAAVLLPLALWGAGRLTAPFQRLAEAAQGDRRAAAFVGGPREAQDAAQALDAMRDRLGEALKERTAIMAAVAHDLRTPLTGLRLRVEGLAAAPREAAAADIARMERLIAQLLTYVRGEDAPWTVEPVDLADLAREVVTRQVAMGRDVRLTAAGEHLVNGDRDQLDRALSNLIDNAVLYGDRAEVAVTSEEGAVVCIIDDSGPGLPPDQLEAVFSPFHRLEASRSRATGGAGLGLAISRSIIERSGGGVALSNRPEGGLRAPVRLPRAAPALSEQGGA